MQLGRRLLEDMKGEHKDKVSNGDNDCDECGVNGDDWYHYVIIYDVYEDYGANNEKNMTIKADNKSALIKVETDKLMEKNFKKEFPGLGFHQVALLVAHILFLFSTLNVYLYDVLQFIIYRFFLPL